MPVVAEFLRDYQDVRMRVQLNDRRVDLLQESVDVASARVNSPTAA
jgi:DNA-binding transcriptional LysR family regulator